MGCYGPLIAEHEEQAMSHLCVLICRVNDDAEAGALTELACVNLAATAVVATYLIRRQATYLIRRRMR